MKSKLITLLCTLLGVMLGTFLAPIAIIIIVWLLQPSDPLGSCAAYQASSEFPSPTEMTDNGATD